VRGCVKNARKAQCCTRDEGGPFETGLQEQVSNSRKLLLSNDGGGERYGKGVRKSRHVRVRETNASEPLMRPRNGSTGGIKTGAPPLSGKSMAETCILAMRCPGYRWRDSNFGSGPELENLFGGDKGKGTSGSSARPKVPIRRAGADCPVVAMKRGNARGAKGAGHPRCDRFGQLATGGAGRLWRKAAAFKGGTSRVTGDCHARFCERLGVKFPGPTRRQRVTAVPTATSRQSCRLKPARQPASKPGGSPHETSTRLT